MLKAQRFLKIIDDAMNSACNSLFAEIYHQTEFQIQNPQISQNLSFKNIIVINDSFRFDYHFLFD